MTHSPEWAKEKAKEFSKILWDSTEDYCGFQDGYIEIVTLKILKALLSAHAEGRKEGMEEAAKIADDMVRGKCCDDISEAIRSATKREVGE